MAVGLDGRWLPRKAERKRRQAGPSVLNVDRAHFAAEVCVKKRRKLFSPFEQPPPRPRWCLTSTELI